MHVAFDSIYGWEHFVLIVWTFGAAYLRFLFEYRSTLGLGHLVTGGNASFADLFL